MRRTPIEIAIDGDQGALDRHRRWMARERAKGINRVIVLIPEHRKAELKALAAAWTEEYRRELAASDFGDSQSVVSTLPGQNA